MNSKPDLPSLLVFSVLTSVGCASGLQTGEFPAPGRVATGPTSSVILAADALADVVAGPDSTCALTKQGRVACWGSGVRVADQPPQHAPLVIDMPPASSVVAGSGTWCAVTRGEGEVWCWGANPDLALGRVTASSSDMRPARVPKLAGVVELVHRAGRSCARNNEGDLWCWGMSRIPTRLDRAAPRGAGPIALGEHEALCTLQPVRCETPKDAGSRRSEKPETPAFERVWGIAGSRRFDGAAVRTCSLESDGSVNCDGGPGFGESNELPPTQPGSLAAGFSHVCGIGFDDAAWCAGRDTEGQVGTPGVLGPVRELAVGGAHTCVLTETRRLLCWGDNTSAQLGLPRPRLRPEPMQVSLPSPASTLARVREDICAQTEQGVFCPSTRCEAPGFEHTGFAKMESGGHRMVCLYTAGGDAECSFDLAGDNDGPKWSGATAASVADAVAKPEGQRWCAKKGQLRRCGDDDPSDDSLHSITTDYQEACGITPKGQLACTQGRDHGMILFDGRFTWASASERLARQTDGTYVRTTLKGVAEPMPREGLVQVSSTNYKSCGVDGQGRGWCWRDRGSTPTQLQIPAKLASVVVTQGHACALDVDGGTWCWGSNDRGQLGSGVPRCARRPYDITPAIEEVFHAE